MNEVDYSQTYWNGKGKHESLNAQLAKLVPRTGMIQGAVDNPALEKFRIASNCYYDLYNNGLCNRADEFRKAFGFGAAKLYREAGGLTQEIVDRTESAMDAIILAAFVEQRSPVESMDRVRRIVALRLPDATGLLTDIDSVASWIKSVAGK